MEENVNNAISLRDLFDSEKESLSQSLQNYSLPKDAEEIHEVVSKYLEKIFDANGAFRQSLTQSEDYILNSALSLLKAQQDMVTEFTIVPELTIKETEETNSAESATTGWNSIMRRIYFFKEKINANPKKSAIAGTVIGGAAGAKVYGTWGALIGAIAGTALVLYCVSFPKEAKVQHAEIKNTPINSNKFIKIVENICVRIDELVETVRNQMQRIKNSYENMEKPSLMGEYSTLMNNLAILFELADSDTEEKNEEIIAQIDMVKRSLKNYGINYENGKLIKK